LIEEGIDKGMNKKEIEAVIGFNEIGVTIEKIAKALNITEERVKQIIKAHQDKK